MQGQSNELAHKLIQALNALIPLAPDWVTGADIATLKSWRGRTVLMRDSYGRKMWGVFYGVEIEEYLISSASKVSIVLTEVSFSEVV